MDIETPVEPKEPPPSPPIFITSRIKYVDLCNKLQTIMKNEFLLQIHNEKYKVKPLICQFFTVIKLRNENNFEYPTHAEKSYRFVTSFYLHHSIPTKYIKEDIESNGFLVKNVTNILKPQTKEPLPLLFVSILTRYQIIKISLN
ncbi:Pre-C2HC domain [Cinara cedri]|uniref:Pre-C2HC domain n=1 Tax=Cinara cedri TaxID=506608 RepID=A0A5E4N2P9_9HEMI|nr:Pre-C2HC domain [Cinara cedri]